MGGGGCFGVIYENLVLSEEEVLCLSGAKIPIEFLQTYRHFLATHRNRVGN